MEAGLFGYNSILVGLAIATFSSTSWSIATVLSTIFFSGFSSVIFVALGKILVPYKSPPLTYPFNIATMCFLLAVNQMSTVNIQPVSKPSLPSDNINNLSNEEDVDLSFMITTADFFTGVIRGIGQVYLADNIISAILILSAICFSSRIAALAALLGALIGPLIGIITGVSSSQLSNGLYGFNPSLSVTAMYMFYAPLEEH